MNGLRLLLAFGAVLATVACSVVLFRGYTRHRVRILMWGTMFFAFLTLNNVALFIEVVAIPNVDLRTARVVFTGLGTACLLSGFVWDLLKAPPDRLTQPRA